jgi:hypothetical protein
MCRLAIYIKTTLLTHTRAQYYDWAREKTWRKGFLYNEEEMDNKEIKKETFKKSFFDAGGILFCSGAEAAGS